MARIKIDLPEKFVFETEIAIRITDINYGGHLGNDSLLGIVHEARMRFLNHLNYSEMDVEGVGLIMSDVAIQYKLEAFYGDTLNVKIGITDIGKIGFDVIYLFQNNKQEEVAVVKTGMVCFDYEKRRPLAVPEAFIRKVTMH